MKLLEVEISNVRGIIHEILASDGKNMVIWGPNGSGKSAVVDAVDFLLTGRVSRLAGKGTGPITLTRHGPHIKRSAEEATVRGVVKLPGIPKPIEIKRCMANPTKCDYDAALRQAVEPLIKLAQRGQHVLTRREVLKFIAAEANTRAQEIQELLDIADIETTRKALVSARNTLSREVNNAEQNFETATNAVQATVQIPKFDIVDVLRAVNESRSILSGKPIEKLCSSELKKGIKLQSTHASEKRVNITLFERDIENLRNALSNVHKQEVKKNDAALRRLIDEIRADPAHLRAYSQIQLIELGRELIDESGNCPLCETEWSPGELSEHLDQRLSVAQNVSRQRAQIHQLSGTITKTLSTVLSCLQAIIKTLQAADEKGPLGTVQAWADNLKVLGGLLAEPVEKYPDERFSVPQVTNLLAPDKVNELLEGVQSRLKLRYPESTPEQNAWDKLTRLEENFKALERCIQEFQSAKLLYRQAEILLESFLKARETVLSDLYRSVKDRFVELYRYLHGSDEGNFAAEITHDGAALQFEVDFHGQGRHPPHALHSEGHQDSMGLCLYLALAEKLTGSFIDLIILDDVMMSVDATHRRQLCRLLKKFFPERQFLITTHDRTWANQLKAEGVVNKGGLFEFYNWHVDTGPHVNRETGLWEKINEDLTRNDVPSAAARLRRGSEEFFGMVCDALKAPVTYKLNGRWELGDFLPAAISRYRDLLKKARAAAQSWGNEESGSMLQEARSTVGQTYARLGVEQWAVNANVHYNNWANFSRDDFYPVVEAFQDLFGHLSCSHRKIYSV